MTNKEYLQNLMDKSSSLYANHTKEYTAERGLFLLPEEANLEWTLAQHELFSFMSSMIVDSLNPDDEHIA